MDSSVSVLESPAVPPIRKIKNIMCYDTEDLLDQAEEFKTFVDEFKDYSWRLLEKETAFLELVLELQKRLVNDAAFIQTAENVTDCHNEMEEAMSKRITVTKERKCKKIFYPSPCLIMMPMITAVRFWRKNSGL
jgi:hypothetical protein